MKKHVILAAAFCLGPAGALAQAQPLKNADPADGEIVVTGEKLKSPKKVCKRLVATGSILPKVTCLPPSEWQAINEKSVATLERLKAEQQSRRNAQQIREAAVAK